MSATNYTPIQLYRTTTASAQPLAGNLADGELAINLTDEKLYFKNAGGTVKLLAANVTPVTNGGTGTSTQFTAGSLVFAGASGVYSQDNANLFWDDSNNRLGIGTATPSVPLTIGDSTAPTNVTVLNTLISTNTAAGVSAAFRKSADSTNGVNIGLLKSRGTAASPTAVNTGDTAGILTFYGYGGTNYRAVATINGIVETYTSDTNVSGYLIFSTNSGGTSATEKMRLDAAGNLGLGVTPSAWGSFYKAIESTAASDFAITSQQNSIEFGRGYYKVNSGFASIATTTQATSKYAQDGNGVHAWYNAPATTVGGTISFTQAMTLDASGNLGVGATSPTSLGSGYKSIDVRGANGGGLVIGTTTPTDIGFLYGNTTGLILQAAGSTLPIIFNTNSGERMRLDASGKLGIGTTAPVDTLTVIGGNIANAISGSGANLQMGRLAMYSTALAGAYVTYGGEIRSYSGAGIDVSDLRFYTANAAPTAERMRLDASGNLAIGDTTSSNYRLHVKVANRGILVTTAGANGGIPALYLTDSTHTVDMVATPESGAGRFGTYTNHPQLFVTNNTERMRIDASGYVQITSNELLPYQGAQTTKNGAATLSSAEIVTGILQYTGNAQTVNFPTGANIEAALTWAGNNVSLDFFVINTGTGTCTMGANGNTTVGVLTVAINTSAQFRIRRTGTNAFTIYRMG